MRPPTSEQTLEQFDSAVRLYQGHYQHQPDEGIDALAVVQRNTKLFLRGDLVAVYWSNGSGERWMVYGRSSRGYSVRGLVMDGARHRGRIEWSSRWNRRTLKEDRHNDKSPMKIVAVPDEIPKREYSGFDPPSLRRWLSEALLAGCGAREVGQGSLALPFETCAPPRGRRPMSPGRRSYRAWCARHAHA